MSLLTQLIGFGLRQVIGDSADDVARIVGVVEKRFRDHSRTLPKALEHAHERAWQALGIALAGDGFLDRVKVLFASGDDRGVREQVQVFLKSNAVSFDGTPAELRQACLDELKRLRKSGLLSASGGSAAEIARQAAGFKRPTDQQGLIEEARQAVDGVADALAGGYPNLSRLLRTPMPAGPPLLAAAFCYFFRREVETDDELAHGLFFDGLRQLSASQSKAFGEVGKALAALGGQFDALFEQLGRIEAAVVETHAVAVETHGAVLDLQAELQRLGGLHLTNAGEIRSLLEQVLSQLGQVGMARGEVRPGNSCSIRGEDERRAVKALLARFRALPAEEQRRMPALLNGLGKLQVGAGDFTEARQTFTEVGQVVGEASGKAEAAFNAYRAALEEKKWDAALAALREAASHYPRRFAPFPLHRYEPKRILGAGGFGAGVLCRDRHFDEDVVVKTLHATDLERGPDEVFREARILRRLSHPVIIVVRDCEYADPTHNARPYQVMDYFPGASLQDFVEKRGPLSLELLLVVAVQIAEGMRAAYAQGVWWTPLSRPKNCIPSVQYRVWIQFHIPTPSGPPCPRRSCSHRRPFTGAEGLRCEQERLCRSANSASAPVHFPRRPALQRLARAFLVVEREVPIQAPLKRRHDLVAPQVHVLVLHRPPQPLHEHVVQAAAPTVHAHRHPGRLQPPRPRLGRELHPLVRVEHLGTAPAQRLLQHLQAERAVQRVRQPPGDHVAAVPVDRRRQVHESRGHRHIRDVRAPHLVGPLDAHVPQQIRVDPMPAPGHAQPGLGVNGLQAHEPQQPLHPLAVDHLALADQPGRHPPAAVERVGRVLPVDQPHQPQVLGRLTRRLVVQARPTKPQQLALPADAQLGVADLDQSTQPFSRVRQLFF